MKEEYRDIKDYEGIYQVSNLGNVKSLAREDSRGHLMSSRIMKQPINYRGYNFVSLYKKGVKTFKYVHALVAEEFLGHESNNLNMVVKHIDGDRFNNDLDNLKIDTKRSTSAVKSNGTSKYVGVSWRKKSNKWVAQIKMNRKKYHLGLFNNEIDAAEAYNEALKKTNTRLIVTN